MAIVLKAASWRRSWLRLPPPPQPASVSEAQAYDDLVEAEERHSAHLQDLLTWNPPIELATVPLQPMLPEPAEPRQQPAEEVAQHRPSTTPVPTDPDDFKSLLERRRRLSR